MPVAMLGLIGMWVGAMVLFAVAAATRSMAVGGVAMIFNAGAAAWTAVYGVRCSTRRIGRAIVSDLNRSREQQLSALEERVAEEITRRVLRGLELRELQAQVAQLTPPRT